jgi:putative phosphoribosyl transferase
MDAVVTSDAAPRRGAGLAAEVARALVVPLDIILVRKLGVPNQPELGMGAIGESGARVINPDVVRYAQVSEAQMAEVERRERAELQRRALRFRGGAPHEPLVGRIAVIGRRHRDRLDRPRRVPGGAGAGRGHGAARGAGGTARGRRGHAR